MAIEFNSKTVPTGVKVSRYNKPVMPPIEDASIQIAGKDGEYVSHSQMMPREILIEFTLVEDTLANFDLKVREFAQFLYSEKPEKLVFTHEPNKYYMAKVHNVTDLSEECDYVAVVEVTFKCSEPFAFDSIAQIPVALPTDNTVATVTNNGDTVSYPTFNILFSNDSTFCSITNHTTNETLQLGADVILGEETAVEWWQEINPLTGSCSDLAEWTHVPNGTPYGMWGGVVTTQFVLKTTTIAGESQTGFGVDSYGAMVLNKYSGASAYRDDIDSDNWSVTFDVQYEAGVPTSAVRANCELYDFLDNKIAKMVLMDYSGITSPMLFFKIYDGTTDDTVTDDSDVIYGGTTGSDTSASIQEGRHRPIGYYYNPTGMIRLRIARRRDLVGINTWTIWIAYINPADGSYSEVLKQDLFSFVDSSSRASLERLSKVRISIGAFDSTIPPLTFIVHSAKVIDELNNPTGKPYIFQDGDQLLVNSGEALILNNGETYYQWLDPSSTFPSLVKGDNEIQVTTIAGALQSVEMTKNERYL